MQKIDKKMAVLSALRQQAGPVTLNELLENLGSAFAERTLRRWLSEMVNEGLIKKIGEKRSTRYMLASMLELKGFFDGREMEAIEYIRQPIFRRSPTTYNKEWLDHYQPNKNFYLPDHYRVQMHAKGRRGIDKNSAGTYARKIYNRLLIDLSYNSSRLEGNTYSLLDTERLILEGTSATGKLDEEKIMILNHKEAIRHLVDTAMKVQIKFDEICTLHFLLSDGLIPTHYSGKIRDYGVRIGGSTYVPLESRDALVNQLQTICQKAAQIQDPFESSLFLLLHLAYLQAFIDVNKRTSRISCNIPLIQHNLVPLSFNDIEKDDYNSAMISIYELNDVRPLVELYYFSYLRSCQHYDVSAETIGYDEVRVRYRQMRRDMTRYVITNQLIGKSIVEYLQIQAEKSIPQVDRLRFINTVLEDLQEINLQRIVGLGITAEQLKSWLKTR